MDKKEKFDYWWKIIFFIIICPILAAAGIYTLFFNPFNFLNLIYFLGMGGGAVLSGYAVAVLIKEYKQHSKE
jgi:hypothetical protein